ncbi:hypothetical protein LPB140_07525 [Sphingorhabdus lutea]|uniref:Phage shock protein B n=1 Tax=Sphingorhabdus lutea TaxID=1913578 RepID=A0A1L3JC13_9SPHN|nr:hypothetical protein [Sphingorhabdus lutea]APG62662.1 hypothetical protein LPB140_07525 [Sphingorhabdus lutea]
MFDEIWILIPLAPFIVGGLAIWSKHKQKEMEFISNKEDGINSDQANRNRALEERVANLERIVTDRGFDLANEIENLRRDELGELNRLKMKQEEKL